MEATSSSWRLSRYNLLLCTMNYVLPLYELLSLTMVGVYESHMTNSLVRDSNHVHEGCALWLQVIHGGWLVFIHECATGVPYFIRVSFPHGGSLSQ